MKIKGIIFDFDGTLFDTMSIWDMAAEKYLLSEDILPRENLVDALREKSLQQGAEYLQQNYLTQKTPAEIEQGINEIIREFYEKKALPKPFVTDFLQSARQLGIKMCIATATDRKLIKSALDRTNISAYFEGVITCAEVGSGKNSPEIYFSALSLVGAEKNSILVFEDALFAATTAKRAGFAVVGVFDSHEPCQKELMQISDYYITDFSMAQNLL